MYSDIGGKMNVYLDLVFLINFMFDLLLLLVTGIECRCFPKKRYLILGSLFGSVTTFFLLIKINNLMLFLFKIIISMLMILITFKVRNKKQFMMLIKSLYGNSIILGGLIYFLNNQISFKNIGIVFIEDKTLLNIIVILISSPIIFYIYSKKNKEDVKKKNLLHRVVIKYKNKEFDMLGYLDTGNDIKDPYKKRSVILIYDKKLNIKIEDALLIPFKSVGGSGLLRCIEPDEIIIDGKQIKNKFLVGTSPINIEIKGASCILPNKIEEEI